MIYIAGTSALSAERKETLKQIILQRYNRILVIQNHEDQMMPA